MESLLSVEALHHLAFHGVFLVSTVRLHVTQRTVLLSQFPLPVCPSVCLSVCHMHALCQNQTMHCRYFDTIWNCNHSSFVIPTVVGVRHPFPLKFVLIVTHPLRNADFDRFALTVQPCIIILLEPVVPRHICTSAGIVRWCTYMSDRTERVNCSTL